MISEIKRKLGFLRFDHGRDARTGSVPIGAVQTLREDATGLFVSARLFDNDAVEPIRQAIEGPAIDGMSFRFRDSRRWFLRSHRIIWTRSRGRRGRRGGIAASYEEGRRP